MQMGEKVLKVMERITKITWMAEEVGRFGLRRHISLKSSCCISRKN